MSLPTTFKGLAGVAVRLAAAFAILYPALACSAGVYGPWLAGLFQKQLELLHPAYHFNRFEYISEGPREGTIELDLKVVVDPRDKIAGARKITGNYPVESLILQPLIVLSVLFAWPAESWHQKIFSLLLGVCGLVLAFMVDQPLQIIWVIDYSLKDYASNSLLLQMWVGFISGGGRLLITIMVIVGALVPNHQILSRRNV